MVTDGGQNTGRPSIVQQRGYYTRLTMAAYHWRNGQLTQNWLFDSNGAGNGQAAGQGDHSSMTADMDGDGGQEITTGALTIGSNGTFRCATGHDHGDALHVGAFIPGQGISVFTVYEGQGGFSVHNGNTCAPSALELAGGDNGRGVAADVDPNNPGAEFWSATKPNLRSCDDGSTVSATKPQSQNFLIYWDADESRELQDGVRIQKYGGGTLLDATGCSGNNGTKNTPNLTADLLGDWREELVVRESNNSALRIYTTTAVTARRIYTLMHDPTYRMQVTWEQSSYNQPPHPGFHIGNGMVAPPEPDIHVR
jgi:rhamnogalacturonan endolyase